MSEHAIWSPSAATKNMACPGAIAMEQGEIDQESEFAAEGTAAHTLAADCLVEKKDADEYIGRVIKVGDKFSFTVDHDMAENVQTYVDNIRAKVKEFLLRGAKSVEVLVEVRVNFSKFVGIEDQFGTSDVVLLAEWPGDYDEIHVADLKFGRGVIVYAERNKQMMHYALGSYDQFAAIGDYGKFSMAIHQPRLNHMDEWECDLDTLLSFGHEIARAAGKAFEVRKMLNAGGDIEPFLNPTEDGCRWCKAKAKCPALAKHVAQEVFDDFSVFDDTAGELPEIIVKRDPELLNRQMKATGIVEDWIAAVRAAVEQELFAGTDIPDYKLVMGKQGNRAWTDAAEAEKKLKHMRIKQEDMYSFKLLSPTVMEKFMKSTPKRWAQLIALIGRRPPVPSVAPKSDKREALKIGNVADEFDIC